MSKITVAALALSALLTAGVALAQTNAASTTPPGGTPPLPVVYPIAGLGGCDSKAACKAYCDVASNRDACYSYAQTHGLMSGAQIALARKLLAAVGPGGCQGEACRRYCADSAHGQVCVAFAQQNGFISKNDAAARLERMKLSSTTRPLPPIPTNSTGTVATSTAATRPALNPNEPGAVRPGLGAPKPPAPQKPATSSAGGQSSSIFFSIVHFLGW